MRTEREGSGTDGPRRTRSGATFLALFGLGFIGVLSLIPTIIGLLDVLLPELVDLPAPLAVLVSLINPLLLLAVAVAVGNSLAHRVGLRSLVAEKVRHGAPVWSRLRPHIPRAFAMGAAFMVVVVAVDTVLRNDRPDRALTVGRGSPPCSPVAP